MKPLFILITILFLVGALLTATASIQPPAQAQSPISDDEVNAVAKNLYCPVCENTPLDVCPTQACKDWREMIRTQLSEGWTEEQVTDYFVDKFGPRVLAQPPAQGFPILVWILPVAALLGGGVVLWRLLRQWQARPAPVEITTVPNISVAPPNIDPEVLARIEREVETRF